MKKIVVAASIFFTHTAIASDQTGRVIDIRVTSKTLNGSTPSHVQLDGTWQGKPSCATLPYWAIDSDTSVGKNMLATILAAQTTGRAVTMWGSNQCDLRGDMETAVQVSLPQ